jgi:hypothetical protein
LRESARDALAAVLVVHDRLVVLRNRYSAGVRRHCQRDIHQRSLLRRSWFFTIAAGIQLLQSKTPTSRSWADPPARADWLAAAIQFVGTLLFNVSTGTELWAHRIPAQRRFVWAPDAAGSVAFLVSATLAVVAVTITLGFLEMKSRDWQAAWVNMVGCVAFGASALGAFVKRTGVTEDALLANVGTFFGALCFLIAALLILPNRSPAATYGVAT